MQEKVTFFNAKKTSTKKPWSPYDDNTFAFETITVESNFELYSILVNQFVLNIPIHISEKIRTFRRKVNLEQFYDKCITYIILDLDKIYSENNKRKVLEYFKDYHCIIGESKSYNGIDNFNMKGILFTDCIEHDDIKPAISYLAHELIDYCEVDEAAGRKATFNAPILRNNIFLNNENSPRFKFERQQAKNIIHAVKEQYISKKTTEIDLTELSTIEADTIEKLCLKVFQSMGYISIKTNPNGSISFKHPSENKSPGGYFWFQSAPYTMHHNNSTKTINIFETIRKLPQAKEMMQKDINYDDEFLKFNADTNVLTVDDRYLRVTNEVTDLVDIFLDNKNGLLSIRSPMGTGKSTIINHIIEECYEVDMRVLIITNRISVAEDFAKKYNIKLYNQDKYNRGDSLICQFDSLWKYDLNNFDIVIMDEFISLMTHSRNNLGNSAFNIIKFFKSFNKKLVIADAFLTGYENFLLENKKSNIHLIDNIYRDPTTLYNYQNENYFFDSLVYHAQKHKITVSATSLQIIDSLNLLLTKKGLKVVTLTAGTPKSTKELIYELFEKEDHDKWDVLIYSPTLTVGVSNLNNIIHHFHYDSSISTDVISSIQMIKRTRKTKEIHMFIKERINYIKTSYNDIRDEYMGNIGKNIDHNYLFDFDNYGEPKLSENGKKAIKIDTFKNILEFNHKEAMIWLLKYHFKFEPRLVERKFSSNILQRYKNEIRENKQAALSDSIETFLDLSNIEKTDIILDADADKTLKALAEIDENVKECNKIVKAKILEIVLKDRSFIKKCKNYRCAFNFTKGIWDASDIKHLVSKAVIKGDNESLKFFNQLLTLGKNEIFDEYDRIVILKQKRLKAILDNCGFYYDKQSAGNDIIGMRTYRIDRNVKEYYGYVKE